MVTLKRLCIDLIVKNFERFYFAFTVSKDHNLQRNFEFLQRKFSVEFLKALCNSEKLKEEYFDLLINEHLKYLKSKWLETTKYLNYTDDIFRRLPNLTRIRFRNCTDDILENVAKFCPNIVKIDVNDSYVTDTGIEYLCERTDEKGCLPCPMLKKIFVDKTRVTKIGVENLIRNLRSLEKIYHQDVPKVLHSINKENIQFNLVELEFFELDFYDLEDYPNFTDVLTSCLALCPKLQTLICYILEEQHLILFDNSHLKRLGLKFREIQHGYGSQHRQPMKANMDNFLKVNGSKLTCLDVEYCTMSVYVLGAYCPNLKEFCGTRVDFTDDNDNLELKFTSLTDCRLDNIQSSPKEVECLLFSSPPNLEAILLNSCNLSLEMKAHILKWCERESAKKITLTDSFIIAHEMEFLKDILSTCSTLEEMRLSSESFIFFNEMDTVESLKRHAESLQNKPLVSFSSI